MVLHFSKMFSVFQHLMRNFSSHWLLLFLILSDTAAVNGDGNKNFYIVYLGGHPASENLAIVAHMQILVAVKRSYHEAKKSLVHSYTKSFNAFAARLSEDEAEKLSAIDDVLAVFRNQYRKLHTTRSWDFIGLPLNARRKQRESDIIVGLFDTGVTPESESFNDKGFGPPPKKWRGSCSHSANFSGCNNKLIGARYFKLDGNPDPVDILSPLDVDGHGTHTSSTSAGNLVPNASLFGLAKGNARGAVPAARVAMYKVCWESSGCADMDILAAFDAAIHDGVDVISISIGGGSSEPLSDPISIGAFHAMRKGILTAASAGNSGPSLGTLSNYAPWVLTVAASGIDRAFRSIIEFGNGKNISGVGISTFSPKKKLYPLISGADASLNSESKESAKFCLEDSLDPKKVKDKVVYCKLEEWGTEAVVKNAGGAGTIFETDQYPDNAQIFMAAATSISTSIGEKIIHYMNSTRSPSAVIYKTREVKTPAPFAASFSSRGPNPGSQHLLKPDIAAPGVNILASYTLLRSITGKSDDTQFSKFTIMSGTSMSCPHLAGVAAYIKSFHSNWTPAAIKSAIMTSATPMSQKVNKDAEFAYGAGQVHPTRAVSPGLIYDMDEFSYIQFLCHEGYNGSALSPLIGSKPINCSKLLPGFGYDSINYPTMQLSLQRNKGLTVGIFRRTVTNVGPGESVYNATIQTPRGVEVTVEPLTLVFSRVMQKLSFKVVVKAKSMPPQQMVSGSLIWRSSRHIVRSPIVIYSPES